MKEAAAAAARTTMAFDKNSPYTAYSALFFNSFRILSFSILTIEFVLPCSAYVPFTGMVSSFTMMSMSVSLCRSYATNFIEVHTFKTMTIVWTNLHVHAKQKRSFLFIGAFVSIFSEKLHIIVHIAKFKQHTQHNEWAREQQRFQMNHSVSFTHHFHRACSPIFIFTVWILWNSESSEEAK